MSLMNSFYGGRKGTSFVIVKNYLDVLSMTLDFARGNDFTEVKFDEYVMINNPNKNHPDNGKIFRRGYDYNSDRTLSAITLLVDKNSNYYQDVTEEKYKDLLDTDSFVTVEDYQKDHSSTFTGIRAAGAEYIGCIVGPAGKAPLLSMGSYEWAYNKNADAGLETRKGQGLYSPSGDNPGLIPGKDGNEYNDSIKWAYASIRNDKYGDDTQAFIGFKFPYLVTQMQTSEVDPYDENGNIADMSNVSRVLGVNETINTHPYYNKWHLDIPKGVKGDTFKNLRVTTYKEWLQGLSGSADRIMYDATQMQLTEYTPGQDNIERAILIYEDWNYDNKQNGQVKYYYLGDYNQIDDITFENGVMTFSFSHDDDKQFIFDYVSEITLQDNGTLTFVHSIIDPETGFKKKNIYTNKLKWITDVSLDTGSFTSSPAYEPEVNEQGDPLYDVNGNPIYKLDQQGNPIQMRDENGELIYSTPIWLPNSEGEGLFKILFNNGNEYRAYIPFVNGMDYNASSGWISYHVIGPDRGHTESLVQVKFIQKILQDPATGKIIIVYNTPREGNIPSDITANESIKTEIGSHECQAFPLKTIQSITLDEQSGNLNVNFIDGSKPETIITDFYTIDTFYYDPVKSKLHIKKSTETEEQVFPLAYPTSIRYNPQNDNIEYMRVGDDSYTQIGNLPLLKDIQLTDNLDLYIQMNGQQGYDIISETDFGNDETHPASQYWINLGNLTKTLSVMGIARNFTRNELYNVIINDDFWGTAQVFESLRRVLADTNEYTKNKISIVTQCLNLIYHDGTVTDINEENNTGDRFRLITVGEDSELKDFFAFDLYKTKTVYQPTTVDGQTTYTTTEEAGSWYFLGRIETSKNTEVGSIGSNTLSQGGILLTKKSDICSISFPDSVNALVPKNKMKEIKLGSSYKNKIGNLSASEGVVITMLGTNNTTAQSYFNRITKEINIPAVTGDITIRRE